MTIIVCGAIIVTDEAHRIVVGDMLGILLHEGSDAIPQGGNGFDEFVQADDETVLLTMILHVLEGVKIYIAEELNTGLDAPVVIVLLHQLVLKEEAGLEATHVAVTDRVAIDDLPLPHVLSDGFGLLLIDKGWERPMLLRYLSIVSFARN